MPTDIVVLSREELREEVARGVAEAIDHVMGEKLRTIEEFNNNAYLGKEWWSATETCRYLNNEFDPETLMRYRREGKLTGSKFGHRVYFHRDDVKRALEEGRIKIGTKEDS